MAFSPGIGIFLGYSGDNKPHRHWAHQLAIGLTKPIEVASNGATHIGQGLFIPAGVVHQLHISEVLCLYIDPTCGVWKSVLADLNRPSLESISILDKHFCEATEGRFAGSENLSVALEGFCSQYESEKTAKPDDRLNTTLMALREAALTGKALSRGELAKLAQLSPSRFSHWFSESTGMPLRSYKKWLKLLVGFELSRNMPLADAAIAAGFSDQAHFCRSVTAAFGVSPATVKRMLSK